MTYYLPDTNAFSDYARGSNAQLLGKMQSATNNRSLLLSCIVLAEMRYGWLKSGDTNRVVAQRAFALALKPGCNCDW